MEEAQESLFDANGSSAIAESMRVQHDRERKVVVRWTIQVCAPCIRSVIALLDKSFGSDTADEKAQRATRCAKIEARCADGSSFWANRNACRAIRAIVKAVAALSLDASTLPDAFAHILIGAFTHSRTA